MSAHKEERERTRRIAEDKQIEKNAIQASQEDRMIARELEEEERDRRIDEILKEDFEVCNKLIVHSRVTLSLLLCDPTLTLFSS